MELKIKKETAKKIYAEAPVSLKKILEETFGKECFRSTNFGDIKTFEDACNNLNMISEEAFNDLDTIDEIAYKKLKVIVRAINQGWTPDWNNTDQYKWYPWFRVSSSGFGFSSSGYGYGGTGAAVGLCLCFESKEKADYAGNQFIALYKKFLM